MTKTETKKLVHDALNEKLGNMRAELERVAEYRATSLKEYERWTEREAVLRERIDAFEDYLTGVVLDGSEPR